ncbi:MAG: hypothetical protein HZB24_00340 [Desulfobacterales bacterium]|nr:hypothetical protein [Desulfobacterales bacterium]
MAFPKVHSSNLIYLVICGTGVIAFLLVAILPNLSAMDQIEADISQLSQKVQNQDLLHPIYMELMKRVQQKTPQDLPFPAKSKISKKEIAGMDAVFQALAKESGVTFISAVPDASSYLEESGHLTMNVAYEGDFFNFKKLLVDICKLPYLRSIEQMQVKTEADTKKIQLKLSLDQE